MATFSLLTLNTFGLPFFLGWWRMMRLPNELNQAEVTLLCLQEIQQNAYVPLLHRHLRNFPHQAVEVNFFTPKGGLLTAARQTFEHQQFIPYNNRGRWWSIGVADWVLGKSILKTKLQEADLPIIVLNTHLHANYGGSWQPGHSLAQIQHDQVRDLAALVQSLPREALVIVCGDLNFPRQIFLYQTLLAESGLIDPLADDPRPTYKSLPLVPAKYSMTLDYILVRLPQQHKVKLVGDILPIEHSAARWPHQRFLTDHCAVTLCASWD